MESKEEHSWRCEWDGEPATWPDYVRKVRLQFEKTRRRRRKYLGPELVSEVTGRAWTVTQEVEHDHLLRPDGAKYLIEYLEARLARVSVPDAGSRAEELFVRLRRPSTMTMASWCQRVRESYRGLQRALKRARRPQGEEDDGSKPSPSAKAASASSRLARSTPSRTPADQARRPCQSQRLVTKKTVPRIRGLLLRAGT